MVNWDALKWTYGTMGFDIVINQIDTAITKGDIETARALLMKIAEHGEIAPMDI
jgi:hypothetical protein